MAEIKTPEQQAEETRRDILAYAYKDTDGKLYTINEKGKRVEAAEGAKALAPQYQQMADQVAAILMMQTKVLTVSPEERTIISQLLEGNVKDREKLGADAKKLLKNVAEFAGFDFSPDTGIFTSIASGVKAPFSILKDSWKAAGEIIDQFGGGEISRENALAFGTSYASARQVARETRPTNGGVMEYVEGGFSRNFFAYLVAVIQFGFNYIKGMLGLETSGKSFDEYLDATMRPSDNSRVLRELTKMKEIGGLDTQETGAAITQGGTLRGTNGDRLIVAPADKNSAAPIATNDKGEVQPTTVDAAEQKRDAERKTLLARLQQAGANADFSDSKEKIGAAGVVGLVGGGAIVAGTAYQGGRGVIEGVRRQEERSLFRTSDAAEKAHDKAQTKVDTAEAAVKNNTKPAKEAKLNARVEEAKAAEARANKAAERAAEAIEKRSAEAADKAAAAAQKIEGGFWKTMTVNLPRHIGRGVGDLMGYAGYLAEKATGWANEVDAKAHAKVAEKVKSLLPEVAQDAAKTAETAGEAAVKNEGIRAKAAAKVAGWMKGFGMKKAAVLALFAGGAATSAQAKEVLGDITGATDIAKGDYARGASSIGDLLSKIGMPSFRDGVDGMRQLDALSKVDPVVVTKLSTMLSADTKKTGDQYLDQAIKLMAAQKRGVTEVAVAPGGSPDDMGKFLYEGKAIKTPNYNANMPAQMLSDPITVKVADLIKTNLQMFVIKGGDVAKLEALLNPGKMDKGLEAAAVDATVRAEKARAQAVAMQSEKPRVGFAYSPMTKSSIGALVNGAPATVSGSRVAAVASPAVAS